jgi:hypothetical protein
LEASVNDPIWMLLAQMTISSESDGLEKVYELDPFPWCLKVANLQYAVEILQDFPGSGTTQLALEHMESASGDISTFASHSTPISYQSVPATLPATFRGEITTDRLPHGRPRLKVKDAATTNPVGCTVRVWSGGKPSS